MNKQINFDSEDQQKEFEEKITQENCGEKLILVRNALAMTQRDLAKCIGCSEATVNRIEKHKTKATKDFLNKLLCLVIIGYAKYRSLNKTEEKHLAEYMGVTGGTAAGVAGAIGLVSASGTIGGISAAGVTSGLTAIGGALMAGAAIVASIPVVACFAGFGIAKGLKAICAANQLDCQEVDGKFEIRIIKL
jgi:DNA-binding XRE family transcriptional regulator